MIPPIYTSTTLKTDLRSVKDATQDTLAIITDGTRGNYLFGSESSIDNDLAELAWEEANAERIIEGIERGREGIAHGEYVIGADAAIALADNLFYEQTMAAADV